MTAMGAKLDTAGAPNRNSRSGVRDGNKQTFVPGDCQRLQRRPYWVIR